MGGRLTDMFLNYVVALTLGLVLWNRHILMQFVLLALDHFGHSAAHLLDKEDVQLRVEPVLVVLVQALNRAFFTEVFLHYPHDRLLHSLLENVVLARLVDFVEELFFALFIGVLGFLRGLSGLGLSLKI